MVLHRSTSGAFTLVPVWLYSDCLPARFGSVVVDDPGALSSKFFTVKRIASLSEEIETIFDATAEAGARAIVSSGWVSFSS
jgi:hypothetical protein